MTHDQKKVLEDMVLERTEELRHTRLQRSEEHTSELQTPDQLVCRLLLEKKNGSHEIGVNSVVSAAGV